jgi:hypothetical protein
VKTRVQIEKAINDLRYCIDSHDDDVSRLAYIAESVLYSVLGNGGWNPVEDDVIPNARILRDEWKSLKKNRREL